MKIDPGTAEWRDTIAGRCPECDERVPGHVYLGPGEVYGWECPMCRRLFDPTEVMTV